MASKTLRIRLEAWANRHGVGVSVNGFEIAMAIHWNDWALGLNFWWWPALSVLVGPVSLRVGFDWKGLQFWGFQAGWLRNKGTPAIYFFLSQNLWWEWHLDK